MLSCIHCLYILDFYPLSITSFAKIFFHSVHCLFILLVVSLAVPKLLILIRPHSFIFALLPFALGDWAKKILLWFMSKKLKPFWVYFLYGVRECSDFIDLHVAVQLSQHHFLRDCLFSIVYTCHLWNRLTIGACVYFWTL